jgi:aminomethyltransferase
MAGGAGFALKIGRVGGGIRWRVPLRSGSSGLRVTPFHARTFELCQSSAWRRWSGYLSPSSYELTLDREYSAIRTTAALLDVSPLTKYVLKGPDAMVALDRLVTRDMTRCKVGQVVYTGWCDADGKLIDDGTVARLSDHRFRLTSAEPTMRWLLQTGAGLDVTIEDVTHDIPTLALQGPASRDILREAVQGIDFDSLGFFRIAPGRVGPDVEVSVSRTGYTGDLGYEIWVEAGDPLTVWDAITAAGRDYGIVPTGMLALDVARIEAGFIMAGVDYVSAHHALVESQTSSPLELGLDWCVHLDAGPFVGKEALVAERDRGPAWKFVGLELDWDSLDRTYMEFGLRPSLPIEAWRSSHPIYRGKRQVGYATSGCWSPTVKKYICLAHVEAEFSNLGTQLDFEMKVEHQPRRIRSHIVERPFFDPARKRA